MPTYLARFVRVGTDGQETRPTVTDIKVHQRYFRSVHVEFWDGGIRLPGSKADWMGATHAPLLGLQTGLGHDV